MLHFFMFLLSSYSICENRLYLVQLMQSKEVNLGFRHDHSISTLLPSVVFRKLIGHVCQVTWFYSSNFADQLQNKHLSFYRLSTVTRCLYKLNKMSTHSWWIATPFSFINWDQIGEQKALYVSTHQVGIWGICVQCLVLSEAVPRPSNGLHYSQAVEYLY